MSDVAALQSPLLFLQKHAHRLHGCANRHDGVLELHIGAGELLAPELDLIRLVRVDSVGGKNASLGSLGSHGLSPVESIRYDAESGMEGLRPPDTPGFLVTNRTDRAESHHASPSRCGTFRSQLVTVGPSEDRALLGACTVAYHLSRKKEWSKGRVLKQRGANPFKNRELSLIK